MHIVTYSDNGSTIDVDTPNLENIAPALWDDGIVEYIRSYYASEYQARMVTATAETALWADASHDDDTEGKGEYKNEIDDLRLGYAPDYEEALPDDALNALESDVENFLRFAWPYLAADNVSPEDAGHDFELTRNGHGSGFWDRGYKYGDNLTDIAQAASAFGLQVSGHGDDIKVYGYYNG